jgi:uncharacterized protein (DUF362 family)
VRYDGKSSALRRAIELCNGFKGLKPNSRVLLKPNNLGSGGSSKLPKYGVVTTSQIVDDLIQLLHERGCKDVSIGEGAIGNEESGSNTLQAYEWSGIARVAKKHGVRLIDFNRESHHEVELEGVKVWISDIALESDFLINVPVLKTHMQTKVSLGLKNLKGCLNMRSKREFHRKGLERMIALLNTRLKPKLTIIDGIYTLERGPGLAGTAHRMNVIIAGKDNLSCDIVGANILGIDPSSVEHLREFSLLARRSLDIATIDVKGENPKDVMKKLEWQWNFQDVFFSQAGITGVCFQDPGKSFCSSCSGSIESAFTEFCRTNKGVALDNVEVCCGSEVRPRRESKKIFLIGNCSIKANRDGEDAIRIGGCPPNASEILLTLMKNTMSTWMIRWILVTRLLQLGATKLGLYDRDSQRYKSYPYPEFERDHF